MSDVLIHEQLEKSYFTADNKSRGEKKKHNHWSCYTEMRDKIYYTGCTAGTENREMTFPIMCLYIWKQTKKGINKEKPALNGVGLLCGLENQAINFVFLPVERRDIKQHATVNWFPEAVVVLEIS